LRESKCKLILMVRRHGSAEDYTKENCDMLEAMLVIKFRLELNCKNCAIENHKGIWR